MSEQLQPVTIENGTLRFKNFAGLEGPFTPAGTRQFSVELPEQSALAMLQDGWNVKRYEGKEEGDEGFYYISISVSYKLRPPLIVMIPEDNPNARVNLTEETVAMLDWAEVLTADLSIRPYNWVVGSGAQQKTGIKAYLQSLYVTVRQDRLAIKYSGANGG